MTPMPSGTLTFLFTDIEGSTRRWEEHPLAMRGALQRHDGLINAAVSRYNGKVVKSIGDGSLSVFVSPTDAVLGAISIQRSILSESWEEVGGLKLRIALHTGEAEERDNDYYGPPLNRAARLMAAGHGGQILLSGVTQALVRENLPEGCHLENLGERRLKDLTHPEQIFQLVVEGLPAEFPPLRTLDVSPTNLPVQQTQFIGRDNETRAIGELLQRPDLHLVTLTGPGGTGKTRLSLEVGANLLQEFEYGVYFVELEPINDPMLVIPTIAKTLGLNENSGREPLDLLTQYLSSKKLLLILDNFEQVTAAAPQLSLLLKNTPRLKVLVTSRHRLRISGEHDYGVPPLALPKLHALPPLDEFTQFEAVRLFIDRAQSLKPEFRITPENAQTVAEICHRLDGLPLTIELAAARIRLLTPHALLTRLDNKLKTLTGGAYDLPARQQTLRGVIDWSYNLLKKEEKLLFLRLAVFIGGWTLEAAEAVCGSDLGDPLDLLSALIDHSLVRVPAVDDDEQSAHFIMLETIREYAVEQLAESGELETLRQQHASYYRAWVEQIEPDSRGARQPLWLAQLELEHNNIRAALKWLLESGDVESALRISAAIWVFWQLHGHLTEGRQWMDSAFNHPQTVQSAIRAKALSGAGWLLAVSNKYEEAQQRFTEGVELARRLGEKRSTGLSLHGVGFMLREQQRYAEAAAAFEESLPLFQAVNDTEHIAWTLLHLGVLSIAQGDYQRSVGQLEQGLAVFRRLGQTWAIAHILGFLGSALQELGDYGRAIREFQESGKFYQQVDDQIYVIQTDFRIGQLYLAQDNAQQATAHFTKALGQFQSMASTGFMIIEAVGGIEALGEIARRANDLQLAVRLYAAAEHLRENLEIPISSFIRRHHERIEAVFTPLRDQPELAEAWQQGASMSLEQAIAHALG